uniref:Phytocyanin domain-containing protein n=1 Tax=Mantoniella antarctica TaxID=81844 RepID=A0A7S0X615_9CHLO
MYRVAMRLTLVAVVLAVATQTAHAATVEVAWSNCFSQSCSPKEITLGDSINFKYSSNHNVVKVSTEAEYTACSAKTNVVGSASVGATGYLHVFNTLGAQYFVCGVGGHCASGQKMVVNVVAASPKPSESPKKTPSPEKTPSTPKPSTPEKSPSPALAKVTAEVKVGVNSSPSPTPPASYSPTKSGAGRIFPSSVATLVTVLLAAAVMLLA